MELSVQQPSEAADDRLWKELGIKVKVLERAVADNEAQVQVLERISLAGKAEVIEVEGALATGDRKMCELERILQAKEAEITSLKSLNGSENNDMTELVGLVAQPRCEFQHQKAPLDHTKQELRPWYGATSATAIRTSRGS